MIVILIIYIACVVRSMKMKKRPEMTDLQKKEIGKIMKKIWAYPIVNFIYWLCRLLLQILSEEDKNKELSFAFLIISSLRGIIYSLLFIFVTDEILRTINELLCCQRSQDEKINEFPPLVKIDTSNLPEPI